MVWIRNTNLKNSIISTRMGNFTFNSKGMALVPQELADELLALGVFTLVDENGNPIDIEPEEPTGIVTLDSGVIWETVEGGYAATDGDKHYTISGSAIKLLDNKVVPSNVEIQNGYIVIADNTDVSNLHVIGVTENDTINVGDKKYYWTELDNDATNGYELALYIPDNPDDTIKPDDPDPQPQTETGVVTLESGVVWETVEGGYAATDGDAKYTISGAAANVDDTGVVLQNVSVENGKISLSPNTDVNNLHVIGVTENDTISVGEQVFYWTDADNDPTNGYELALYTSTNPDDTIKPDDPDPQPQTDTSVVTLPSGWETVESGLAYSDESLTITLQGANLNEDGTLPLTLEGETLIFDENTDTENIHVLGVKDGDTVYVGSNPYIWKDVDGNLENGYEIATISSGEDTVKPDDPDPEPSTETGVVTLESGVVWETVEGGYAATDGDKHYTISGSAVEVDDTGVVSSNIQIEDGQIIVSSDTDLTNLHVIGVTENDTINVGDKTYYWTDADSDTTNGYELVEYIATNPDDTIKPDDPQTDTGVVTLPSGWETVESGLAYSDTAIAITIQGASVDAEGNLPVTVEGETLIFNENSDTENIHVLGVKDGDTLYVGSNPFVWKDLDGNLENGLEIATISSGDDTIKPDDPEPQTETGVVTLESGVVWETVEGGYAATDGDKHYTISGSAVEVDDTGVVPSNIVVSNGEVSISNTIDVDNLHVIGITENDTINVGNKTYYWTDADNDATNGYELALYTSPNPDDTIKPDDPESQTETGVVTLESGVVWETVEGGYAATDGDKHYTLSGSAVEVDDTGVVPNNIVVSNGQISVSSDADIAELHVIGVTENDTINVGDKTYYWTDADSDTTNGYELVEYTATNPDDTIKPVNPDDTIKPDDPQTDTGISDGFSYDFNGINFTLSGGLNSQVTANDLNENTEFNYNGLKFGDNIISNVDQVHIQGLSEGTTVEIAGQKFELHDADNNPENGLEIVGDDAFGWKHLNKSSGIYEPAIWKHYNESNEIDIVVIGCNSRPILEENVLTLEGDNLKVISNELSDTLIINGPVQGILTPRAGWEDKVGLIHGINTNSHILQGDTLYLPKATIKGITTVPEYKLRGGIFTIWYGEVDITNLKITGSITNVIYNNQTYYVNSKTGQVVPNAWQKR